jgi:peroxiredoxin Q/BCP
MVSAGTPFPAFSLPNQDGKTQKLSDFAGQWLVIYFYPKDDTPGCTIQGKSFTATKADFDNAGSTPRFDVVLLEIGWMF